MQFNLNTLKKLPQIDLVNFAKNLRDYLKLAIKSSGGHYASPIGAVGITVAIHYIFDSPDDIFVFDTGHQCYAHKIITGRHDTFESIRKANGISGFPEPSESNHDHFRVGHAGTAIAIAIGFSITPSDHWVIVIIGDSAFANGVSLESLLLIHKANRPVIIIVNDNGHSISDAVSSLKTMNSKRYEALAVAADIHFSGSIDGNEPDELANKLIGIKKSRKSTLLHVRTIKGYSDEIASLNPFKYHAIPSAKLKSTFPTTKKNSQEILSDFLVNVAQQMKILFVSAGMAETAGFNSVTKNTNINYLDVGIAEHSGFTIAAAACRDFDLTFIHIYSTFLQRE
ncbi:MULTISPECIES: 1-deoxy-D-xylulose-5-phosphate synthase N-terminal domain-containing protein [unclassified Acinetobacter]|uniref:1-deoxy-D-xylulose-5-phosphate synthase N-terminal domain-containing protein n=1 Tax=unclassified Acinetobacter TaxID=196816 RepID=UPI002934D024|nr:MULTISPECIES: 1-deoxy-D-xylulose-5-phosphate synthase N-terminal domain-containing protein [unclassified Acinetobacter]WOE33291.1 1-deoxy-D-xylulose-5-phosphate synthase N-terminal domain-containing protein [Acinetobacter sp. SAAs470]WOE36931.1 1-deoxy-D-xylulose-5-phosphate synthase N-terminal domain-containing protein [Acinetobacter sp. SAAs474]